MRHTKFTFLDDNETAGYRVGCIGYRRLHMFFCITMNIRLPYLDNQLNDFRTSKNNGS